MRPLVSDAQDALHANAVHELLMSFASPLVSIADLLLVAAADTAPILVQVCVWGGRRLWVAKSCLTIHS